MLRYSIVIKTILPGLLLLFLIFTVPQLITTYWSSSVSSIAQKIYQAKHLSNRLSFQAELATRPKALSIQNPVVGAAGNSFTDTWGAARSEGRRHEGVDIFADRSTYIVSPVDGVVSRIGYGIRGGNFVFVSGPGNERNYFAHLDEVDMALEEGQIVTANTTILGTVGNTGNAETTPPHLHLGIYGFGGATNPYPRLVTN